MISVAFRYDGDVAEYYFGDGDRIVVVFETSMLFIFKFAEMQREVYIPRETAKQLARRIHLYSKVFDRRRN